MQDLFSETRFYFVKTDDDKYSLFNIATDKLILADVDKKEINKFLNDNNPTHPSLPTTGNNPFQGSPLYSPMGSYGYYWDSSSNSPNQYSLVTSSVPSFFDESHSSWEDFMFGDSDIDFGDFGKED